jgi:uncharacterized protein (TIGR02145 family)
VPTFGTLLDIRDNTTYQTVTICTQTWMAEDLNYDTPDSVHQKFPNASTNYQFPDTILWGIDTVLNGKRLYNGVSMLVSCPNGWHIPSEREMSILEINLGMNPLDTIYFTQDPSTINGEVFRACSISPSMMSTTGWQNKGTNSSGFNLIGPDYITLWTSSLQDPRFTIHDYEKPSLSIYYSGRDFHHTTDYIRKYPRNILNWHSCRCLQD